MLTTKGISNEGLREDRAADWIDAGQVGQDPLITAFATGQPQAAVYPSQRLCEQVRVSSWIFEYMNFNTEHLNSVNTERGMRADIKTGDWEVSTTAARLKIFSFASPKDTDEMGNAHPTLRIRERSAILSKRMVQLDIERRVKTLLTTSGNYGGNVTTLGATAEWDNQTNGNSLANITTAVDAILAVIPVMPSEISVFLPLASLRSAYNDPVFKAARNTAGKVTFPTVEELRTYWGVGEVWSTNIVDKTAAGVVGPMYPDSAIVYYRGPGVGLDTEYGDFTWTANFSLDGGSALSPWYENKNSTWYFPWQEYAYPAIINAGAGYLIENTTA